MRPRFKGDAREYRRLIRNEKLVLESIQAAENDDLALHLYEAHLLKWEHDKQQNHGTPGETSKANAECLQDEADTGQEGRQEESVITGDTNKDDTKGRPEAETKQDHWKDDHTEISKHATRGPQNKANTGHERLQGRHEDGARWRVPTSWTAWPLPVEEVPVEEQRWVRKRDFAILESGDEKSSTDRVETEKASQELEELLLAEMTKFSRGVFEEWQSRLEDERRIELSIKPTVKPIDVMQTVENDGDSATSGSNSSSALVNEQERAIDQATQADVESDDQSDRSASPALPADDDKTQLLAKPSIRHIIQKIECLLVNLHRSRRAKRKPPPNSVPPHDLLSKDETSSIRPLKKQRLSSKEKNIFEVQTNSRVHRVRGRSTRDWSEVLGNAMLTGWDEGIVKRAISRCSELFGEQMRIHTFHEGSIEEQDNRLSPITSGLICSEETCERHEKPFDRKSNWTRHMLISHGFKETGPETFLVVRRGESTGCPMQSCKRMRPFESDMSLNFHMENIHPNVKWVTHNQTSRPATSNLMVRDFFASGETAHSHSSNIPLRHGTPAPGRSRSGSVVSSSTSILSAAEGSADDMYGGVHVDGFLKPIQLRGDWRTRSRSTSVVSSRESSVAADATTDDNDSTDMTNDGDDTTSDSE